MTAIRSTAYASPAAPSAVVSPARAGIRAGVTAIVAVIVLHVIGTAAGASWLLSMPGAGTIPVPLPSVVTSAIIPIVIGTVALFIARRSPRAVAALAWAGLAVGLLTVVAPLSADGDLLARVLLAAMHVAVGVAWFCAVPRRGAAT